MRSRIDRALADVEQAQATLRIQLRTFLMSPGRESAARLDGAIQDQSSVIEAIAGGRFHYLAK
jgi:hypothetical protein